jgi:hypothetical protein
MNGIIYEFFTMLRFVDYIFDDKKAFAILFSAPAFILKGCKYCIWQG